MISTFNARNFKHFKLVPVTEKTGLCLSWSEISYSLEAAHVFSTPYGILAWTYVKETWPFAISDDLRPMSSRFSGNGLTDVDQTG